MELPELFGGDLLSEAYLFVKASFVTDFDGLNSEVVLS